MYMYEIYMGAAVVRGVNAGSGDLFGGLSDHLFGLVLMRLSAELFFAGADMKS
jgi:hypothetical protein